MADTSNTSYKSIFKATSLFGGVQVFKILVNIIKQKLLAILIGPEGVGILGLFTSATQLVQGVTSMGLSSSAVRNIVAANSTGDNLIIGKTIRTFRKLIWITGILGTVSVILLAPVLSQTSFGNNSYTLSFIVLSVLLLIQQISSGQSVLLQGMRKLKDLAKTGIYGSLLGLIFTIPIYFWGKERGIVPALIIEALFLLACSYYYSRKIKLEKTFLSFSEMKSIGSNMLGMGLAMILNNFIVLGLGYVVRAYISNVGSSSQVGLYTAGITIVNSYVGMIFSAMATDYFPRLSSIKDNNDKCNQLVNEQAEIATIIIVPLASIFILLSPILISILYSTEFSGIIFFMRICMVSMLFKACSWAISYSFIAKSDMKLFLINEISGNLVSLPIYIFCYKYGGLDALGIGHFFGVLIYCFIVFINAKRQYQLAFNKDYIVYFLKSIFLMAVMVVVLSYNGSLLSYSISSVFTIYIIYYSYISLDKKINLTKFIKEKLNK